MNYSIGSELISASSAMNMHVEEIAKGQTVAESSFSVRHAREHIQAARVMCRDTTNVDKFSETASIVLAEAGFLIVPHKSIIDMHLELMSSVDKMLGVADGVLDMEYYYDGEKGLDVFITAVDEAASLCLKILSLALDDIGLARRLLWRARLVVDRRMALDKSWDNLPSSRWEKFDNTAREAEKGL